MGAKKIHAILSRKRITEIPAVSTINRILKRNGCISIEESNKRKEYVRFEREQPNDLWQMDFKGHFPLLFERCHPLTILDDHSRFSICLKACGNEQYLTVKDGIINAFQEYGMPNSMTMDNGSPWGSGAGEYSELDIFLMRLGIRVIHSRPYHPETQGKDERFHRTLKEELINRVSFRNLTEAQEGFNRWRDEYNFNRPHEAINMLSPIERYTPSKRPFVNVIAPIEYLSDDIVRKVDCSGSISYNGLAIKVGKAFRQQYVALRQKDEGLINIFFCQQIIKTINLYDI